MFHRTICTLITYNIILSYPILCYFIFLVFLSYPIHPILPILSFRKLALHVASWLNEFFQVLPWISDSPHNWLLQSVLLITWKNCLTLDFVYIRCSLLPGSLVSKHQNPEASITQTATPRLGIRTPPIPAQVQCPRFFRVGGRLRQWVTELLGWTAGGLVHASWVRASMLCNPEFGPGESTVAKDKGTKAPLNYPDELTAMVVWAKSILFVGLVFSCCLFVLDDFFFGEEWWEEAVFQFPAAYTFSLLCIYYVQSCPRCRYSSYTAQAILLNKSGATSVLLGTWVLFLKPPTKHVHVKSGISCSFLKPRINIICYWLTFLPWMTKTFPFEF